MFKGSHVSAVGNTARYWSNSERDGFAIDQKFAEGEHASIYVVRDANLVVLAGSGGTAYVYNADGELVQQIDENKIAASLGIKGTSDRLYPESFGQLGKLAFLQPTRRFDGRLQTRLHFAIGTDGLAELDLLSGRLTARLRPEHHGPLRVINRVNSSRLTQQIAVGMGGMFLFGLVVFGLFHLRLRFRS